MALGADVRSRPDNQPPDKHVESTSVNCLDEGSTPSSSTKTHTRSLTLVWTGLSAKPTAYHDSAQLHNPRASLTAVRTGFAPLRSQGDAATPSSSSDNRLTPSLFVLSGKSVKIVTQKRHFFVFIIGGKEKVFTFGSVSDFFSVYRNKKDT